MTADTFWTIAILVFAFLVLAVIIPRPAPRGDHWNDE